MFRPILQQTTQRRRYADFAAVLLLAIAIFWTAYSLWRGGQVPKIESLTIAPNSVVVLGPADRVTSGGKLEFCPGDQMTIRYDLAVEGEGAIYADDAAHHENHTVKFSTLWRDVVERGTRTYENDWTIPPRPDMALDGRREWLPGSYTRVISVAASNNYISRYVPPATVKVNFVIGEDCSP